MNYVQLVNRECRALDGTVRVLCCCTRMSTYFVEGLYKWVHPYFFLACVAWRVKAFLSIFPPRLRAAMALVYRGFAAFLALSNCLKTAKLRKLYFFIISSRKLSSNLTNLHIVEEPKHNFLFFQYIPHK